MRAFLTKFRRYRYFALIIFMIVFAVLPLVLPNTYAVYVINRGLTNAIAVTGLVILYGIAGQISLGHVAFFAIGAYTSAILSKTYGVPVLVSIPISILVSSLFGFLLSIPAFKLSGPFLSICTVAFGELIRQLLLNLESLTGGPYGFNGVPALVLFGTRIREDRVWYYILLALVMLTGLVSLRIRSSRYGRALYAIKGDELAASIMGINVRRLKMFAFICAAFFGGLSGSVYAHYAGFLSQEMALSSQSSSLFSMAVLGGTDSIVGGLWSAIALTVAPEIMRFLQEYYIMILNLLVLLVVLVPWSQIFARLKARFAHKERAVA